MDPYHSLMASAADPSSPDPSLSDPFAGAARIATRLDALPFTRKHRKILAGSGIGWALDAMDVGLISFIITALVKEWGLEPGQASWIASVGFIGMAIGAGLGGLLADRWGRRQVFALTLLVYGIATGASALVSGLAALLVLRFLVGLGLGAELPVASTYVSEFAPARIRGRLIVLLEAFWAVGWTLAALIGFFVVPRIDDGWRWAFALGAVPAIYALAVRWALPESPRWLVQHGRVSEAEKIVADFESAAGRTAEDSAPGAAPAASGQPEPIARHRLSGLWRGEFRTRTACLWLVWFCVNFAYYGAFIWIPTILYNQGYDLVKSFGFTLIITLAQLPGYAAAAWLIEVWGRRLTLSVFLVGSVASAMVFGTAVSETMIIVSGMALSFFNLGAWGALYAVTPEMYPTSLRATGSGWAAGVGRIASIIAPLLVPLLLDLGGKPLLFAIFAAFFAVAAVSAWGLADKRGVALDDR